MKTEYATYEDLKFLALGSVHDGSELSALSGSLLKLPQALPSDVAALLWPMSTFGNDFSESVHDIFEDLAAAPDTGLVDAIITMSGSDGRFEDVLAALEQAIDDPELAGMLEPGPQEIARMAHSLNEVELCRLLLHELSTSGTDVTPGKLVLSMRMDIAGLVLARFPELETVLDDLFAEDEAATQQISEARQFRNTIKQQEKSTKLLTGFSDMNHIEILEATCDDPDTLAVLALDKRGAADEAKLFALLDDADPMYTGQWLTGLTRVTPEPGQLERFAQTHSDEQLRKAAAQVEALRKEGHEIEHLPWLAEMMQHIYIPDVTLSMAHAAFVWDVFQREFGDDAALWGAGIGLLISSEDPIRFDDVA